MLSQSSSQADVDDNLNDNDDVQPTASVTNSAPPHANDNNIHAPIDDQDVKIKKDKNSMSIFELRNEEIRQDKECGNDDEAAVEQTDAN